MKIFLFTLLTSLVLVLGCSDDQTSLPDKETSLVNDMKKTYRDSLFEKCIIHFEGFSEKFADGCSCYADYLVDNLSLANLNKMDNPEEVNKTVTDSWSGGTDWFELTYFYALSNYEVGYIFIKADKKCEPEFKSQSTIEYWMENKNK